jgi:hypothetical protein
MKAAKSVGKPAPRCVAPAIAFWFHFWNQIFDSHTFHCHMQIRGHRGWHNHIFIRSNFEILPAPFSILACLVRVDRSSRVAPAATVEAGLFRR